MRRWSLSVIAALALTMTGCGGDDAKEPSKAASTSSAAETTESKPTPGHQNYSSLAELHAAVLAAGVPCGPLATDTDVAPALATGRCALPAGDLVLYLWPTASARASAVSSARDTLRDQGFCLVTGDGTEEDEGAWSIDAVVDRDVCSTLSLKLPGSFVSYEPPPPPPAFTFKCVGASYSTTVPPYTSLDEVWAAAPTQQLSSCTVAMGPTYVPSPNDLAAVEAYRAFVPSEVPKGALETMMGICAKSWATEDELLRWQPTVLKGALMLCPNAPHAGLMGPLANSEVFRDGTYVVGQSVQPGTYTTQPGVEGCYWERTSGGGGILANDFVTFAPDGVTVTIRSSDGGFVSDGCGRWHKVG